MDNPHLGMNSRVTSDRYRLRLHDVFLVTSRYTCAHIRCPSNVGSLYTKKPFILRPCTVLTGEERACVKSSRARRLSVDFPKSTAVAS
ncbi:hypothetical protein EVAR_4130_1 [Eumeta japonica]|uniref:Uncharacterized protein n=1 Tax=Eumeta variegata TaxID=151549 RepID=A0A4C2A1U0_EUMVA|nr:hypothetical protein EVAR_4130_1 [Eumeta japonica]